MGSGKTTIGQILSEVLGYSFIDRFVVWLLVYMLLTWSEIWAYESTLFELNIIHWIAFQLNNVHVFYDCSDKLIEQAAGGTAVADIFKHRGESYFRDNEVSGILYFYGYHLHRMCLYFIKVFLLSLDWGTS